MDKAKLPWVATGDRLPEKPGHRPYEHVECLVLHNGRLRILPWNCEHLCWDDEHGDDFLLHPKEPSHWIAVSALLLPPTATQKEG